MRMGIQADNLGAPIVLPPGSAVPVAADRNPACVYLASLAAGSRRTMRHALDTIASLVNPSLIAETVPWHRVEYQHVMAIRARLVDHGYAPSMINKMLSAFRGTLRAAFNLGLMNSDQFMRAAGVKAVRGSRVTAGRALEARELRALYAVYDASRADGARNAAVRAGPGRTP